MFCSVCLWLPLLFLFIGRNGPGGGHSVMRSFFIFIILIFKTYILVLEKRFYLFNLCSSLLRLVCAKEIVFFLLILAEITQSWFRTCFLCWVELKIHFSLIGLGAFFLLQDQYNDKRFPLNFSLSERKCLYLVNSSLSNGLVTWIRLIGCATTTMMATRASLIYIFNNGKR